MVIHPLVVSLAVSYQCQSAWVVCRQLLEFPLRPAPSSQCLDASGPLPLSLSFYLLLRLAGKPLLALLHGWVVCVPSPVNHDVLLVVGKSAVFLGGVSRSI